MLMYRRVWVRLPVFAYPQSDDSHLTLVNCMCGLTGLHLSHSEVYFKSRSDGYAHLFAYYQQTYGFIDCKYLTYWHQRAHQLFVFNLIHPLPH